jgi:hypothetical protein
MVFGSQFCLVLYVRVGWIKTGVKAMAFMMPCPVQLFAIGELDDAKRWLSESLGSIQIGSEGDVITARLFGKLDPGAYDGVNEEIDNVMSHAEHVRLVLDLREFDGWKNHGQVRECPDQVFRFR